MGLLIILGASTRSIRRFSCMTLLCAYLRTDATYCERNIYSWPSGVVYLLRYLSKASSNPEEATTGGF